MTFGEAVEAMREGKKMRRPGQYSQYAYIRMTLTGAFRWENSKTPKAYDYSLNIEDVDATDWTEVTP